MSKAITDLRARSPWAKPGKRKKLTEAQERFGKSFKRRGQRKNTQAERPEQEGITCSFLVLSSS